MNGTVTSVVCVAAVVTWGAPLPHARAQEAAAADVRCGALFEEAVGQLAAEQYPRMRKVAQDRMLLCPDPISSFLLGLSEANMVDGLLVGDRGQREQLRRSALRHLRVAAAGESTLEPEWQMTTHEWIVHLTELGGGVEDVEPPSAAVDSALGFDGAYGGEETWGDLDIPPAPPPQPQPEFPWGPVVSLVVGTGALTTGIVLGVNAEAKSDEAKSAARRLHSLNDAGTVSREQVAEWARETERLQGEAQSEGAWATGFIVGGAATLVVAGIWYWLLPPEGHWRWAAAPTGVRTTARF